MKIGIDLDNTLIFYDDAFRHEAISRGLLPKNFSGGKQQLRDAIRQLPDGETLWQQLQGHVYGKGLRQASLFPGAVEFLAACTSAGHELFIVSHKTEFGHFDPDRVNLRDAAKAWLEENGIFSHIDAKYIFFAATRAEKIAIIQKLSLDWFIDDLIEVFEEPDFPAYTEMVLFHTSATPAKKGKWLEASNWRDVKGIVLSLNLDWEQILNSRKPQASGGNSRIYKIYHHDKPYAFKRYPEIKDDMRDRLNVERKALQFMKANGIACVPEWHKANPPYAVLEWIEGAPVDKPDEADIDAAVDFLSQIFRLSHPLPNPPPERGRGLSEMPLASEACLSADSILQQIERRLEKLQGIEGLAEFLEQEFLPAMRERVAAAKAAYAKQGWDFKRELPQAERALIPADFGFHNALKNRQGLVFLDFEYFGYDDPVKLIADFLLHPAMALEPALKAQFFAKMMEIHHAQPSVNARFSALYPLFGLRWTLILLNEFLPERWQARALASGESDWEDAKRRQLKKAREMLTNSAVYKD